MLVFVFEVSVVEIISCWSSMLYFFCFKILSRIHVNACYNKFCWKRAVMCVKYLDDLWAPFPTNSFSVDFEMATVHSLLSFIGRTWEKGTRRVDLSHWKISSWTWPSYHTKDINFSRHIGRGRREEPEKLIPNPRSCKCSLTSLSNRSEIVLSLTLWLKSRRIFPSFLIWEKNAKSARQIN